MLLKNNIVKRQLELEKRGRKQYSVKTLFVETKHEIPVNVNETFSFLS